MKSISTTVPEDLYEKIEKLAEAGGVRVTAWARAVLIQEARKATIFGVRPIDIATEVAQHSGNEPQSVSASSVIIPSSDFVGGCSTATIKSSRKAG